MLRQLCFDYMLKDVTSNSKFCRTRKKYLIGIGNENVNMSKLGHVRQIAHKSKIVQRNELNKTKHELILEKIL